MHDLVELPMIYLFDTNGVCLRSINTEHEDPDIKAQHIALEQAACSAAVAIEADAAYAIDEVYNAGGTVTPFTAAEMAAKNELTEGLVWKMPERIIVDNRDLAFIKRTKLAEMKIRCDALLDPLKASYPEGEQQSWDKQEQEARALEANVNAPAPLLSYWLPHVACRSMSWPPA